MIKKPVKLWGIILAVVLAIGIISTYMIININTIGSFTLDDYQEQIKNYTDYFPKEEVPGLTGAIESSAQAKKVAEQLWRETYGDSILSKKPYRVSYDDKNQVWLVRGTVFFVEGGYWPSGMINFK